MKKFLIVGIWIILKIMVGKINILNIQICKELIDYNVYNNKIYLNTMNIKILFLKLKLFKVLLYIKYI